MAGLEITKKIIFVSFEQLTVFYTINKTRIFKSTKDKEIDFLKNI